MNRLEQLEIIFACEALAKKPQKVILQGKFVRLEPFDTAKHHRSLYQNLARTPKAFGWLIEPDIASLEEFRQFCVSREADQGFTHFVVSKIDHPEDIIGINSLHKADTKDKNISMELGLSSSKLSGTAGSTEAYYLLMRYVFDELGFLKLNVGKVFPQNTRAIRTLERLGFTLEIQNKNGLVVKGYAFDVTEWEMIESKWFVVKKGMEQWLAHYNFDVQRKQISKLSFVHRKVML